MNPLLIKFAPWGVALAVGAAFAVHVITSAEERGKLEERATRAEFVADSAGKEAARWQAAAVHDSLRAIALEAAYQAAARVAHADSLSFAARVAELGNARTALDSLVEHPATLADSLPPGLREALANFERSSDSTVASCRGAIASEARATMACQLARGALASELANVKRELADMILVRDQTVIERDAAKGAIPSGLSTWLWRLVFAAGGYGLGHLKR